MKHKSAVHKEAVRLYLKEKEKPGGMLLRQVQDHIAKKYSVTVHYSRISRYANEGLLNASPKKMGPACTFAKSMYKLLCDALSSFIPINQMNARAGDNSRIKLIDTLVKTLSISSTKASTLLTRLLRDTAEDKMNCAEDRRIRWTTFQNLDLWFNSWEFFLIEFGFAYHNANGELVFEDDALSRILNMDETFISLDGSKW